MERTRARSARIRASAAMPVYLTGGGAAHRATPAASSSMTGCAAAELAIRR